MTASLPRVAVTGAGGLIGRAVCARLVADGRPVIGAMRRTDAWFRPTGRL